MTDQREPFNGLDLREIIDLRWTLRGIRAKRWKMSLIPLGNAEIDERDRMHDDEPELTKAGLDALP
jgi:hypothetical protein